MQKIDTTAVVAMCTAHGFSLAGVAAASRSVHDTSFVKWLADGKHGEMEWLNRNVEVRVDPTRLVEGAKSVICVADRYGECQERPLGRFQGSIARYARGDDYHKVMKRRLHAISDELAKAYPQETFKSCVDTAPLFERECAAAAGIGSIGKHTLLIEQGVGSWMLLGAIVTTLGLEPTGRDEVDPCATCTRCIDACPTDAITPWNVDARKCISYLTIEHRSEIDPTYFSAIGRRIFGCDICQEVCPHNQPTERTREVPIQESYRTKREALDVSEVLDWDEQRRRDVFKGSSMKRAKLSMMRRNALIVAGNILAAEWDELLYAKVCRIAEGDDDPLVRATAMEVMAIHPRGLGSGVGSDPRPGTGSDPTPGPRPGTGSPGTGSDPTPGPRPGTGSDPTPDPRPGTGSDPRHDPRPGTGSDPRSEH